MLKCNINGKDVEVKEGTLVIDAVKQANDDIAHYCYHPGLSVAGVCRLCMVKIEGNPRLQIACNTVVQDGMVISNQDDDVKESVKWGLDFHLINHPLDCPICDQAGECQLQIQYMKFGQYDPEMAEKKVKKHKVVDLGSKIVLDSERCILCSRCVRFTSEVSKTNELGIFNRGDRSEIGTFEGTPLENDYAMNTVDICPVGALTSKDFRFQQRVWYLKNQETVCTGCSTGCNVKAYYNEEGFYRVKPVYNEKVNGYWMCDKGRDIYKYVNKEYRLTEAKFSNNGEVSESSAGSAVKDLAASLDASTALVVTGQYTNEEYDSLLDYFVNTVGTKQVYHWKNNPEKFEDFDGLLLRGDKNPNTKGLLTAMKKAGLSTQWSELEASLNSGKVKTVVVAGPENQQYFPTIKEKISLFAKADNVVWFSANPVDGLEATNSVQIPIKTYVEKSGTFTNHESYDQKIESITTVVKGALSLSEACSIMQGNEALLEDLTLNAVTKTNFFLENSEGY